MRGIACGNVSYPKRELDSRFEGVAKTMQASICVHAVGAGLQDNLSDDCFPSPVRSYGLVRRSNFIGRLFGLRGQSLAKGVSTSGLIQRVTRVGKQFPERAAVRGDYRCSKGHSQW